jgi:hypothetical protein
MGAAAARWETALREEAAALRACTCGRCSGLAALVLGMVVPRDENGRTDRIPFLKWSVDLDRK